MLLWNFRTFVSPTDRNDVQKTIDEYDVYTSQYFQRRLRHLAVTDLKGWDEPHSKKLKKEDPLYEIRYQGNKRQERALGYFDGNCFVIVLICYHKDRVYTPRDAFKIAHRRIGQLKNQTASTAPLEIDGEDFS